MGLNHAQIMARLKQAGLRPKKSWGQNFLVDTRVLAAIVASLGAPRAEPVIELGAGTGALTWEMGRFGHRVVAVERDRDLVPLLRALAGEAPTDPPSDPDRRWLEVLEADAARLDYPALRHQYGAPLALVGNLPYQLSGRILVSVAHHPAAVQSATVMVQREVAERLMAEPNTKAYGLLTVLVGRNFFVSHVLDVPPKAFFPPPKVHSSVVRLEAHTEAGEICDAEDKNLVAAARAAFGSRRKMLRNSLLSHLNADKERVDAALTCAAVAPESRAETLGIGDFRRLGQALFNAGILAS